MVNDRQGDTRFTEMRKPNESRSWLFHPMAGLGFVRSKTKGKVLLLVPLQPDNLFDRRWVNIERNSECASGSSFAAEDTRVAPSPKPFPGSVQQTTTHQFFLLKRESE